MFIYLRGVIDSAINKKDIEKVRNMTKRRKIKGIQSWRVQLLKTKRMLLWFSFVIFFIVFRKRFCET